MSQQFKLGDKVVCTRTSSVLFTEGKQYEVVMNPIDCVGCDNYGLRTECGGFISLPYLSSKFELVPVTPEPETASEYRPLKEGDYIFITDSCVDYVTERKIYQVVEICDNTYSILDDNEDTLWFAVNGSPCVTAFTNLSALAEAADCIDDHHYILEELAEIVLDNHLAISTWEDTVAELAEWCDEHGPIPGRKEPRPKAPVTRPAETESTLPDSGERSTFETGAVRDASSGKGLPSCIPTSALRAVARRFEDGAVKYDRDNWKKGIPLSKYIDSLDRHTWAFMDGDHTEDHLGAIIWNSMCLQWTVTQIVEGNLPESLNDGEYDLDGIITH